MLPHAEPVHKVSIIPRGLAALGYTMSLPLEDRYLMSLDELRDKMAGMMGGRAAEEIFIGEISTGAANDFKQATEIARMMVREYGMSSALGPVTLGQDHVNPFLRSAIGAEPRDYSEQTARLVDEEIRGIVSEALDRARATLRSYRDQVEALAARLLSSEVVEQDELRRILGPKVTVQAALLADQASEEKRGEGRDENPAPAGPWGQTQA
jgi:cell division protease FtsH